MAVVAASIVVVSSVLFAPVVGLIFAALVVGTGFFLQRALDKPEGYAQDYGKADVLNRLWFPVQDELVEVVNVGGRVTDAASAWTRAPGLSKRETPGTFYSGMQRYVLQRGHVASLAAGDLASEDSRQELASEQQKLLTMALALLEEVDRTIDLIPGATTINRRPPRGMQRPANRAV